MKYMITKFTNSLAIIVVAVAGMMVFTIKEKAALLSYQLNETLRQCKNEEDKIHILQAEFAYLSSPMRLSVIAANYLKLSSINTSQLIQNPLNQDIAIAEQKDLLSANNLRKTNVKWRYKKAPSKYVNNVQTVSSKVR